MPEHPKRSEDRIRRNKVDIETVKVQSPEVKPPNIDIKGLHPIARDFYNSLKKSAQTRYFEPSDWQFARYLTYLLNETLNSSKPNAQLVTAINSMANDLLVSEGSRRKLRMEIQRSDQVEETESSADKVVNMYKSMFERESA